MRGFIISFIISFIIIVIIFEKMLADLRFENTELKKEKSELEEEKKKDKALLEELEAYKEVIRKWANKERE